MLFFASKPLVFLRVSAPYQYLTNQRYEVSSFLKKQNVTDAVYLEMKGSAFRNVHPLMFNLVESMLPMVGTNRPSCIVFAAVDRVSRNYDSGVHFMEMIRSMNIPVLFVRTPHVNIFTSEGWASMLELLRSSEIEAQNLSARSKAAWELRREAGDLDNTGPKKRPRDGMDVDDAPPAKRPYPTSLYLYSQLTEEQMGKYYSNMLYLLYLFGHDAAPLKTVLTQIKLMHTKYAPELLVEKYGLRTGKKHWSHDEVFVGSNEDFANILNSYNLSPVAPNMHDRWSSENIEDVFTNIIDQIPNLDTTTSVLPRRDFIELVKDIPPHYLKKDDTV